MVRLHYEVNNEKREKLLQRVGLKCIDFAIQFSYYRAFYIYRTKLSLNFWICMFNNSIDLAILDWFHLFGNHNDDLHWKNLVIDIDSFKRKLFNHVEMTEDEWRSYREKIKIYRDKDIAHIEVRPKSQVPELSIALKAASYYYDYVLKELSEFADYNSWPNNLAEYHQRSLEQTKKIVELAFVSTRGIKEEVF